MLLHPRRSSSSDNFALMSLKQHLLAVYIITFYYFHAIRNLEKFIFVKTTSKKKIPKKEVKGLRHN